MKSSFQVLIFIAFLIIFSCQKTSKDAEVSKLWNVDQINVSEENPFWVATDQEEVHVLSMIFVAENLSDLVHEDALLASKFTYYQVTNSGAWRILLEDHFNTHTIVHRNSKGVWENFSGTTLFHEYANRNQRLLLFYDKNLNEAFPERFFSEDLMLNTDERLKNNVKIYIDLRHLTVANQDENSPQIFKTEFTYVRRDGKKVVKTAVMNNNNQ